MDKEWTCSHEDILMTKVFTPGREGDFKKDQRVARNKTSGTGTESKNRQR